MGDSGPWWLHPPPEGVAVVQLWARAWERKFRVSYKAFYPPSIRARTVPIPVARSIRAFCYVRIACNPAMSRDPIAP